MIEQLKDTSVNLKRIFIESRLPEALLPLHELANNLWWSWNKEAIDLFQEIQPDRWVGYQYNPLLLLDNLSRDRAKQLVADAAFMARLKQVHQAFQHYMGEKKPKDAARIVYFSMEFGLHISVRLYSGGLGVLAGDFLKEASDQNVQLAGVGLLYRYGYFQQSISLHGEQISNFPPQEYTKLPIEPVRDEQGEWLKIAIDLPGRQVWAKVWMLPVGRVPLYLLDTDIPDNSWEDRALTHQLYGGNNEHRLKQEILLGIGGVRAMEAMNFHGDVYHCNEGHAAFMGLERIRNLVSSGDYQFAEALEIVRSSSLFTTHTPVPAGHDYFSENLLHAYFQDYLQGLGINWEHFMSLGKIDRYNPGELFSMSHLAIRMSQEVNGVSELHGTVSQDMFKVLYPALSQEEVPVGFVTNGIHYPTWVANEWHQLYLETMGAAMLQDQSNKERWAAIQDVDPVRIMAIRNHLKAKLLHYVREQLRKDLTRRGEKPGTIFEVLDGIRSDALILGFARRFATYKRAHLLFNNLERLSEIVNDPDRPVMFIFAGKAHPADIPGQQLIRDIIHISKQPEFAGKVIFLEGYNMEMAKILVQGVDIWLNTPTRPKEASGTSGMKAAINGVMNFSVLDGWWAEGYRPDAGWALPLEGTYEDAALQDELDAETIYNILENDVVPTFFERDEQGISPRWVSFIKNIIAKVGPDFTMKRMMDDYFSRYYNRLVAGGRKVVAQKGKLARELAVWKTQMRQMWTGVHVVDKTIFDTDNYSLALGEDFQVAVTIFCNSIPATHFELEMLFFKRISDERLELRFKQPLALKKTEGQLATFSGQVHPDYAGVFEYGFRLLPRHPELGRQADVNLCSWL